MRHQQLSAIILIIVVILGVSFLLWDGKPIPTSLAYPPPTSYAPSGYPAPATYTPSSLSTYLPPDGQLGTPYWSDPTWTPWPSPTPHPFVLAVDPRQGIAGSNVYIPERDFFGSWGYAWGAAPPNPWPSNVEYVPMAYGDVINPDLSASTATAEWSVLETRVVRFATKRAPLDPPPPTPPTNHYYLVFNECEHDAQCNAHPEDAARFYRTFVDYMATVDPYAKFIVGGVNASPCGILWLQEFVIAYRDIHGVDVPRTGWHFHLYPEIVAGGWNPTNDDPLRGCQTWLTPTRPPSTPQYKWVEAQERLNFETWREDAENMFDFVVEYGDIDNDEIWITEMGCPHSDPSWPQSCGATETFMYNYTSQILEWLNSEGRWVDRYAWFADWLPDKEHFTLLYDFTPTPTPTKGGYVPSGPTPTSQWNPSTLGYFYANVTPAAALKPEPALWMPIINR